MEEEILSHADVGSVELRRGKILEEWEYYGAIICQVESKKTGEILWRTTMTTAEYIDACKTGETPYAYTGSMLDYFKRTCWLEDVIVYYIKT